MSRLNRRLDAEQLPAVYWPQVWRSMKAARHCKRVSAHWHWSAAWDIDAGYCLDRHGTKTEYAEVEAIAQKNSEAE